MCLRRFFSTNNICVSVSLWCVRQQKCLLKALERIDVEDQSGLTDTHITDSDSFTLSNVSETTQKHCKNTFHTLCFLYCFPIQTFLNQDTVVWEANRIPVTYFFKLMSQKWNSDVCPFTVSRDALDRWILYSPFYSQQREASIPVTSSLYVTMEILSNWGHPSQVGLTEIQFFCPQNQKLFVSPHDLDIRNTDQPGNLAALVNGKTKVHILKTLLRSAKDNIESVFLNCVFCV